MQRINKCVLSVCKRLGELLMDLSWIWIWIWIWIEVDMEMTEMAETHVELNQFPVPRVGPRHSTYALLLVLYLRNKHAILLYLLREG